jgi:hypothetical protein
MIRWTHHTFMTVIETFQECKCRYRASIRPTWTDPRCTVTPILPVRLIADTQLCASDGRPVAS